ncbi:hypothetical protein VP01_1255g3 [Puccinia sorghi]|uniref:Uncharacterized protein n=1 Tax=Puccinia sorghi TaxID=27349 RepID=A0A0L6VPA3_9BASI|nr:hypothetical protein VP01_1255g3 [Puccinia sorghi]
MQALQNPWAKNGTTNNHQSPINHAQAPINQGQDTSINYKLALQQALDQQAARRHEEMLNLARKFEAKLLEHQTSTTSKNQKTLTKSQSKKNKWIQFLDSPEGEENFLSKGSPDGHPSKS